LSDTALLNYENSTGSPLAPSTLVGTLNLYATAGPGYLPDTVITLSGTCIASGGYLVLNQTSVSFGGVLVGGGTPSQASKSITLTNLGSSSLTFTGFAWQDYYGGMAYNNVTSSTVGNGYTATAFPALGSTLAAGSLINIPLVFLPASTGIHASFLTFWSTGGYTDILMQGNAQQGSTSSLTSLTISSSRISSTSSTTLKTTSSTSSVVKTSSIPTTTSGSPTTTPAAPTGPTNLSTIGSYSYIGCYTEATGGRALTGLEYANNNMTIEICYAMCAGYIWFGIEYHRECKSFARR
jgi:hypothetical protein